jgi:hypothetical protein
MKAFIHGMWVLLFLCATNLARAQEKPPDLQAEYEKLSKEFSAAQKEYYSPYDAAKTDEESSKIRLDPEKDPRKAFVPRFEELALRAKGSETACQCWIWVVQNANGDSTAQRLAFEAIAADHIASPALEGFVSRLAWTRSQLGPKQTDELLETILAKSPHESVRAAVLITQATVLLGGGQAGAAELALAREKLERVQREFGKTRYAARAEGMIFEAEHLQIGMEVPDFEALDQDGKPWKLSDYRGKVVVIDFWGYW